MGARDGKGSGVIRGRLWVGLLSFQLMAGFLGHVG